MMKKTKLVRCSYADACVMGTSETLPLRKYPWFNMLGCIHSTPHKAPCWAKGWRLCSNTNIKIRCMEVEDEA